MISASTAQTGSSFRPTNVSVLQEERSIMNLECVYLAIFSIVTTALQSTSVVLAQRATNCTVMTVSALKIQLLIIKLIHVSTAKSKTVKYAPTPTIARLAWIHLSRKKVNVFVLKAQLSATLQDNASHVRSAIAQDVTQTIHVKCA